MKTFYIEKMDKHGFTLLKFKIKNLFKYKTTIIKKTEII